ncbi:hypothetical protein GGR02_000676 [Anoxybacillus voinovskiensis]|uniref:Uncharacterized protein n=1 Tax=Anoxybacteroides voinovskiense TaxID=230470 RepID=A0A840DV00_9BACL|nr:hypothetical protein [Anoxybacillus voinovskiensis]
MLDTLVSGIVDLIMGVVFEDPLKEIWKKWTK